MWVVNGAKRHAILVFGTVLAFGVMAAVRRSGMPIYLRRSVANIQTTFGVRGFATTLNRHTAGNAVCFCCRALPIKKLQLDELPQSIHRLLGKSRVAALAFVAYESIFRRESTTPLTKMAFLTICPIAATTCSPQILACLATTVGVPSRTNGYRDAINLHCNSKCAWIHSICVILLVRRGGKIIINCIGRDLSHDFTILCDIRCDTQGRRSRQR
mmetsp:Transcript_98124/g.245997  ORF Transcript_98124/g.245997 Transcript_98124/m.245997 type:complete len:214 (+) Transcript_98124:1436-2077(+)